jgi:regulator of chromosome condensation
VPIVKLLCGGMHTVMLSKFGIPYSWGCNDDKCLGRDGSEEEILPVPLDVAVDDIAVGDSNSIFVNTSLGVVYMVGIYRVSCKKYDALEYKWQSWRPCRKADFNW